MSNLMTRTPVVIATEINNIKDQTRKMFLYNSIEIGKRLAEAKQMVPHGEWGRWLEESVDYSASTARNLIKIFEEYSADQFSLFEDNAKSQLLGELSYTQAVALLGVPAEEREAFIKENDIDSMSTRELQKAIKDKQQLERELKESEERAEKERVAREKVEQEIQKLDSQKEKQAQALNKLKFQLEKAQQTDNEEDVEKLQSLLGQTNDELVEYKEKIKKLEQQLKEKPIDVPTVVEKVPEEIEKELKELREKVAKGSNQEEIKFKFCFEKIVSDFKELLGTLNAIEDNEKYKAAVRGLIGKMNERL